MTPIGCCPATVWSAAVEGRSGIGRVTRFDASSFRSRLAAEILDFDFSRYSTSRPSSRLDRFSRFAIAAAHSALVDAGLMKEATPADRKGSVLERDDLRSGAVYLGSALGGIAFGEEQHEKYLASGIRSVSPSLALSIFAGAAATNVAMEFNLRGPAISNANSCASGAVAIGEAFHSIRNGNVSFALAGGVECPLAPLTFGSFSLIRSMSKRNNDPTAACRPFDKDRDGFIMGEGAAILVIEEWDRAVERGAKIHAEILGYASTNDAHDMTVPRPDGSEAARAGEMALHDGDVSAQDVDFIAAHATGTVLGDAAEMAAIRRVFGDDMPPITATKPLHGHSLGASSAIEACITTMALERGFLPGTRNLVHADPTCMGNHVLPPGLPGGYKLALSNAFGFGGINACLVFAKA